MFYIAVMALETFRITEDTGEWHIMGALPENDYQAARILNVMYDVTRRKVGDNRHLNVIVDELPSAGC